MAKRDKRLVSKFVTNLLDAEEAYLKAGGWVQKKDGLWWNPEFTVGLPQTYAVIISKSKDRNIGLP